MTTRTSRLGRRSALVIDFGMIAIKKTSRLPRGVDQVGLPSAWKVVVPKMTMSLPRTGVEKVLGMFIAMTVLEIYPPPTVPRNIDYGLRARQLAEIPPSTGLNIHPSS